MKTANLFLERLLMSDSVVHLKRNEASGRVNLAPELQKIAQAFEEPESIFDFEVDWENEVLGPDEAIRLVGKTRNSVTSLMAVFGVQSLPSTLNELASLTNSCLVIKSKLRLIRDWGFDFERAEDDLVLKVITLNEIAALEGVRLESELDPETKLKLHQLYLEISAQMNA